MRAAVISKQKGPKAEISRFGIEKAKETAAFHASMPEYCVTPLKKLENLAKSLGIQAFYVKDESKRFGLNAFKGLGGSFAIHSVASGEHEIFVTATDGNHGRGVAWAAARLGHESYVFLPAGSVRERLENIRKLGAHAEIMDLPYDDTVRYAAKMAKEHGWTLVQDTSWEGYEEIPTLIMQGYTTMGYEITKQLQGVKPTHVFLQAGVGSMAGAMAAFLADFYGDERPVIVLVEPDSAECFYLTAKADDGRIHNCEGEMHSMMAGLCCGEPCPIAWDILKDYGDYAIACDDSAAVTGMRTLGRPLGTDPCIISGESGASTTGAAVQILSLEENAQIKELLKLDENSVVLCISTEGDTDKENYKRILSGIE